MKTINKQGRAGNILIGMLLLLMAVIMVYPVLYCVAYSLSDSMQVMIHPVSFFPVGFTLDNYMVIFQNPAIYRSFFVSVARTVCGIVYTLLITGLASYAISKKTLPGRKLLSWYLLIPMYVSGGLIPMYVLIYKLNLINNILVYIIPNGFATFYMLLMRTYFESLPDSLEEAARLDGAGDLTIFFKVIMPLSRPIVATVAMYIGVWQWNTWLDANLYITKFELLPMQSILQKMLLESFSSDLQAQAQLALGAQGTSPETLRMAAVVVSTIPIVCIYPFFQKYFAKGVMIGAVKQ
ncbi:carbohydrate ABC transporter permease [Diplocloster agilis]|uniref:carbohydrate ABC transporter permease n=1 Tax=Diplocloster agilis TaxID=2850323 RepID=UPI000820F86E|nr:carbohydrate ABC transporter permease [Suonthocola fibrivorans]MCU6733272.1 carbohydrate ABC transporter permease [Suonthocola fibrivorans]SCI83449.1 Inner membrane ABC transporter permease protein ycjP [uncultured Clostridium sp.]